MVVCSHRPAGLIVVYHLGIPCGFYAVFLQPDFAFLLGPWKRCYAISAPVLVPAWVGYTNVAAIVRTKGDCFLADSLDKSLNVSGVAMVASSLMALNAYAVWLS